MPPSWSSNELIAGNTANTGWLATAENIAKGGLATGGVITASALFSVTMTAVLQALPMVQALMLLGIYALLPMIVVLSRYSLSMMVVGAMAIFTVKFWSVLWYLAMWVDQNLILSMYPDVNVFLQIFATPGEHDAKRMLLNMITTSLYLGLPLLWSGMMAWAGCTSDVQSRWQRALYATPLRMPDGGAALWQKRQSVRESVVRGRQP